MKPISTDHGSVLPADASALVVTVDGELSLMLADAPEDASLPRMTLLLAAVALRATDEEWVEETLAIFDSRYCS
jgi:hypothetical protein